MTTKEDGRTDSELAAMFSELGFVTGSNRLMTLLRQSYKAAQVSDATVLIEGETGVGKQVLAEAIYHLDSKRSTYPFLVLHCGTLQETLAESELFGHKRGAFSGAVEDRKGLFQSAHPGTVFLDDINDLPMSLQVKLLDVLQRRRIRAVGSDRECPLNVRIIASCNRPLAQLVSQGLFRADLYYRLDIIRLVIPPLRERPEDLPALVLALARRYTSLYGSIGSIDDGLARLLTQQPFAGNVRELEHTVQRMLIAKTEGSSLSLDDWMGQQLERAPRCEEDELGSAATHLWNAITKRGASFDSVFREAEKKLLERALGDGGPRRLLAARLGISERNLYHKLREHRVQNTHQSAAKDGTRGAKSGSAMESLTQIA